MKLFITNRTEFENTIENECELNTRCLNSYLIHKKTFNELSIYINSKNSIPIDIIIDIIGDEEKYICFTFENKKNDIYYYSFKSI